MVTSIGVNGSKPWLLLCLNLMETDADRGSFQVILLAERHEQLDEHGFLCGLWDLFDNDLLLRIGAGGGIRTSRSSCVLRLLTFPLLRELCESSV